MALSCVVIGAGLAGAQRKDGNHAATVLENPHAKLLGIFDVDFKLSSSAAKQLGCTAFESLDQAISTDPELLIIAVHPAHRAEIFKKALGNKNIKAILCEKPLADTFEDAQSYVKSCQEAGVRLYTNYQRRGNPTYRNLKNDIDSGARGQIQNANWYYTRGMNTNACHWLDLSLMLFGNPTHITAVPSPVPSPYANDPNATLILNYKTFNVQLIPLLSWNEGFYTGDLELIFEKQKLFIPNITHYETRQAKKWVADSTHRLQEVACDFELVSPANDFADLFEIVVSDLQNYRPGHSERSEESRPQDDGALSVRLLDLAKTSLTEGKRLEVFTF